MKRKITNIGEVKTSENKNTYVLLTFDACIENGMLLKQELRAFFASEELLSQIEIGMEMIVEPLAS